MAIQMRRGSYADFDPTKLVAGELAVVLDGDPNSASGRALYVCFEPGAVWRIADYEDIMDLIDAASEDVQSQFTAAIQAAITQATSAASNASSAATQANQATQSANEAASAANEAAAAAVDDVNAAVQAANEAAQEAQAAAATVQDVSDKTVEFTPAAVLEQIESGETVATLFGKMSRLMSSVDAVLKAHGDLIVPYGTVVTSKTSVAINATAATNSAEYFQAGTNQLTVNRPGDYLVVLYVMYSNTSNSTNVRTLELIKNGAGLLSVLSRDGSYEARSITRIINFSSGDVLSFKARDEGGNSTFHEGRATLLPLIM